MFTIRWVNCITIMKWDSWENKQLIHRKCKAILSLQNESHDKTDGPWVMNPLFWVFKTQRYFKNHPPNISRPHSIQ